MNLIVSKHGDADFVGHVPNFLSEKEVDILYSINKDRAWGYAGTRWSGFNSKIRKCKKRSNIEFPFYDRLMKYVNLYNSRTYNFHLYKERKRHEINMVRYDEKGMFFRPHRDYRPSLTDIYNKKTARKFKKNKKNKRTPLIRDTSTTNWNWKKYQNRI